MASVRAKPIPPNLIDALDYNDGKLYWSHKASYKRDIGKEAGRSANLHGYHKIKYKGMAYPVHRVVYAMFHGDSLDMEIDHIDGDRSNNKIENLRLANRSQNTINTRNNAINTTGVVGVYWHKRDGRWTAFIRKNDRSLHLGNFGHIFEAAAARKSAENRFYGEYAVR